MRGAILPLPNTSSWRGAYLSTGTALPFIFTFTFTFTLSCILCHLLFMQLNEGGVGGGGEYNRHGRGEKRT
jgi:hypothetical protein